MNREIDVQVDDINSEPKKVIFTDGSYLQWDWKDGFYRVAYYNRVAKKGSDLEMTIALAMKKPLHNSKVKNVFKFISRSDEYAAVGS